MQKSKIEWTDTTWNPMTGCTQTSGGCSHCYAKRQAERLQRMGTVGYENGFEVTCHLDRLSQPSSWKRKRRVFVCSMGDLFHGSVPDSFIAEVYIAMMDSDDHDYMVLTKRPGRMAHLLKAFIARDPGYRMEKIQHIAHGVSVENHHNISRWETLSRSVPSKKKFVSFEPLIGDVLPFYSHLRDHRYLYDETDMTIIGGESGPCARIMEDEWALKLVKAAQNSGTKVFVKQMGSAWAKKVGSSTPKGSDMSEWLPELQVQQHMFDEE